MQALCCRWDRTIQLLVWVILSSYLSITVYGQGSAAQFSAPTVTNQVVLPPSVPDPIEPFNRAMWAFNKGLMTDVIKPTGRVYRFVIRKPAREGIDNFSRNLLYPGRLVNNLLQEKWPGARDETYRFMVNSTWGVGGIFDVATRKHIPKSDADFGQTFGVWGWRPQCYIMLPIYGPSNERDTVGLAADTAANPLLYISPYNPTAHDPLTYLGPYSYFTYAAMYNNLADEVDEYVRFSQAEMDPYSEIQYAWTFKRANLVANFQVKGQRDPASLETLQSVFFTYKDPEFPNHGVTRSVLIPGTGRKLKFTYWLQAGHAPIVYIAPGLGSHRLAESSLALAELAYKNGFSAVCVSSVFNSEFMDSAATTALPGYLPVDGQDLHVALTAIDHHLNTLYPNRLGKRALLGYSMGAFDTLYLAATQATNQAPLIKFDRYVSISSPVRLAYGMSQLDQYYQAPLAWPVIDRTDDIENTFLKMADLSATKLTPQTSLPFNAIESKFLIGLTFRFTLRDIIYDSQRRHNMGILHQPLRDWRRDPAYREIMQYSFQDYFQKFAIPYYQRQGLAEPTADTMATADDLRTYQAALHDNPDIRLIMNENDFLLSADDLAWYRNNFTADQMTIFKEGGHLGNLVNPAVQRTILGALTGLDSAKLK